MTPQQLGIQSHFAAHPAHLVLEEHAQGLTSDLELYVNQKPAHVVVALDGRAGPPVADTLSMTSG